MDPNETLRQLRAAGRQWELDGRLADYDVAALLDLVQAMDEWLSTGGFLPTEWER